MARPQRVPSFSATASRPQQLTHDQQISRQVQQVIRNLGRQRPSSGHNLPEVVAMPRGGVLPQISGVRARGRARVGRGATATSTFPRARGSAARGAPAAFTLPGPQGLSNLPVPRAIPGGISTNFPWHVFSEQANSLLWAANGDYRPDPKGGPFRAHTPAMKAALAAGYQVVQKFVIPDPAQAAAPAQSPRHFPNDLANVDVNQRTRDLAPLREQRTQDPTPWTIIQQRTLIPVRAVPDYTQLPSRTNAMGPIPTGVQPLDSVCKPNGVSIPNNNFGAFSKTVCRTDTNAKLYLDANRRQALEREVEYCYPGETSVPLNQDYGILTMRPTITHLPRPDVSGWSNEQRANFGHLGSDGSLTWLERRRGFRVAMGYVWWDCVPGFPQSFNSWIPPAFQDEGYRRRRGVPGQGPTHYNHFCLYPNCGRIFTSETAWNDHIRREHLWLYLRCPICGALFQSLEQARLHRKLGQGAPGGQPGDRIKRIACASNCWMVITGEQSAGQYFQLPADAVTDEDRSRQQGGPKGPPPPPPPPGGAITV